MSKPLKSLGFDAINPWFFVLLQTGVPEHALGVFADDGRYHVLQFRVAHGLGKRGAFGGFLESGLGFPKLRLILFGVEVTGGSPQP